MPATSNSVANEAIVMMGGNQPPVTGQAPNFDQSASGKALAVLYQPTVNAIARKYNWDFTRQTIVLTASGNAPPAGFAQEYLYPAGVEVWQLAPPLPLADPNNPLPVNFTVGSRVVAGAQARVIWANQPNAVAFYNGSPNEGIWDDLFHQAVVRLLSGALSLALAGRPDQAFALIESGGQFEAAGETREN